MSELDPRQTFASTSAAGAMRSLQVGGPVLVGCMLAGLVTSTAHALPTDHALSWRRPIEQTTSGSAVAVTEPPGRAIGELRRLSGFTWEQLARLFNVSRRSLHFWASGKPMAPNNEEHLQRLLSVVRKIDRGSASANRALLVGAREEGRLPLDLLAAGEYDLVLSLLGPGDTHRASPPKLSKQARAARAPSPPEELVGALQDRIHRDRGAARVAQSVKVRSGG